MASNFRAAATAALVLLALAAVPSPDGGGRVGAQIRTGQTAARKVATVTSLARFPFFFHTQAVRVRGAASEANGTFQLERDGARVYLVPGGTGKLPDPGKDVEVTGTY